jgi:hypothetical protein
MKPRFQDERKQSRQVVERQFEIERLRQESERLTKKLNAKEFEEDPKTMTWLQAGKHTLRLSVLGFIILGLQHQYQWLGDWITTSNMAPMLVVFLSFFGKSGTDLDWRGRARLLCSFACVVALLTLFNQLVMGVSAADSRDWLPLVLAINLMIWLFSDGFARLAKRKEG